jgi:hypothetical protein
MNALRILFFCSLFTFTSFSQTYQIDELRIYSWNDAAMPPDWQQDFTEQYTYGNGGNKETKIVGTSFPNLDNVSQHIKTYNANNDIKTDVLYAWDPTPPGSWIVISQTLYDYNTTTNNLISETSQTYNPVSMTFFNSSRELFEDYEGANAKKQTNQTWNLTPPGSWENVEKVDITYTSGMPTLALYSLWDSVTTMDWLPPYEQDTATYNGSLLDQVITENFDTGELDRSTYTYLGGLLDTVLFESSSDGGTNWDPYDRELLSYDANDNNTVLIFEDNSTGPWVGYFKQEKDFSVAAPLSTETFNASNFNAFPNPVGDVLYMKFNLPLSNMAVAEVYSVDGRLIKSQNINSGVESSNIELHNLVKGIYLLQIKNNNDKKTIRIIKE